MNKHDLKIHREHYNNVRAGTKTFEIRKNDRAFQKGDIVTLSLWVETMNGFKYQIDQGHPVLKFKVGDVYPIDAETVVFSLLPLD